MTVYLLSRVAVSLSITLYLMFAHATAAEMQEAGMAIWTQCDLLKAINITVPARDHFLHEIKKSVAFCVVAAQNASEQLSNDQLINLVDLFEQLIKTLQEICADEQNVLIVEHSRLLQDIIDHLLKSTKQYQQ